MNKDVLWKGIAILAVVGLIIIALISVVLLLINTKPSLISTSCVGVLRIEGPIDLKSSGGFNYYIPGAEEYAQAIRSASSDPRIKGLFVIINSPGGSIVASDMVYRELKRFNKPKVSYIEELGASGGYYVALGTNKIYAHQNSLVGNIGVIFYLTNYEGLMEKIGINITVVKSGNKKDIISPYRVPTEEELSIIKDIINETYEQFKEILLDARYIAEDSLNLVLDGRIFTGNMAKKIGLVDDVGLKRDFMEKFANDLGVDSENICDITPKKSSIGLLSLYNEFIGVIAQLKYGYSLRAQ